MIKSFGRSGFARRRVMAGLAISVLLGANSGPVGASPPAITGTYNVAIIQVSYVDATVHRFTLSQLNAATTEIRNYYSDLSNGKLTVNVRIGHAGFTAAPKTRAHYWDPCAADGSDSRSPCPPPLLSDAVNKAVDAGMSMSGVNGVVVLSPWLGGGVTFGPADVTVGSSHYHVQQSYEFEGCNPYPSCPQIGSDPSTPGAPGPSKVWWNSWAHEIGHEIEHQTGITLYGNWLGHPGGYSSGYDLMDSGYPLGESVYGLSQPEVGDKAIFPGWLDPVHVKTVTAPSSGSVSTTWHLTPMGSPTTTSASDVRGLKLSIYPGVYLTVEARRNVGADAFGTGPGLFDQGIKIDSVQEQADPPEHPVDACDYLISGGCVRSNSDSRWSNCQGNGPSLAQSHPYCYPFELWHAGTTFTDSADHITVSISAYHQTGNFYPVTVTRQPNTQHPDVAFTPWLTSPMNTWETQDIWVDSPCNGYGTYRYGQRADGTAVGNGDDPCAGHANRLYARVRNIGTAPAQHVVVGFDATDPLGVGIQGAQGWASINSVNESQFPALASLAPGAYTDVYVTWNPTVDTTHLEDGASFAFHSCVRVHATPVVGELVTGNQDGDGEQENFAYFQAPVSGSAGPQQSAAQRASVVTVAGAVPLINVDDKKVMTPRTYYLESTADLPTGGGYAFDGGAAAVTLRPAETRTLPVKMWVPSTAPAGQIYQVKVDAITTSIELNPAIPSTSEIPGPSHTEAGVVSGAVLGVHTVLPTTLAVAATEDSTHQTTVSGKLSPAAGGERVMVDYVTEFGDTVSHLITVTSKGTYSDSLPQPKGKVVLVRAIYAGTMTQQSAWQQIVPTSV